MKIPLVILLSVLIFSIHPRSSYADYDSFTVNVPNAQGGYTSIVIKQSGSGYVGPQGEYYPQFPSVVQLQNVYGLTSQSVTAQPDTSQDDEDISVPVAPPELPVYEQPETPGPEYIWVPGYWAYNSFIQDYYWVPGTWVLPPSEGSVWTPGFWYWREGRYAYSEGYWGDHVGFYGGINYGHGYKGNGVSSFNGGPGGTNAKPTFTDQAAMKERHIPPTFVQISHAQAAVKNTGLRASVNHGMPAVAATAKPAVFQGKNVMAARQSGTVYRNTKPIIATKTTAKPHTVKKPLPKTSSTDAVPKISGN